MLPMSYHCSSKTEFTISRHDQRRGQSMRYDNVSVRSVAVHIYQLQSLYMNENVKLAWMMMTMIMMMMIIERTISSHAKVNNPWLTAVCPRFVDKLRAGSVTLFTWQVTTDFGSSSCPGFLSGVCCSSHQESSQVYLNPKAAPHKVRLSWSNSF